MRRRAFLGGALGLLAGCTGEEPAPVSTPAPAPPPPASPVWKVETIHELVPKAPARLQAFATPVPPLPAYDEALTTLGDILERHALDPDNPWALAHALLARGADLRLADGRDVIDHLVAGFAEPAAGGFLFPKARGSIRIEPHADLLLKNLGEAGASPDRPVRVGGTETTLAGLYRATVLRTFLVPQDNLSSFAEPNDTPWALQALAQWAPDPKLQWLATNGTPMDLDGLANFVIAVLTQESGWAFAKMKKGEPLERQGQKLYGYTCGGAHLLQGGCYGAARGFGSAPARAGVEAQAALWFYRLPHELRQYDAALEQHKKERVRLLVQRMKFLGHFLESLSKMAILGLVVPSEDQRMRLEGAAQNLALTVGALKETGILDKMADLRTRDEQLYLDIVGDACHALRGLDLALGRGKLGW